MIGFRMLGRLGFVFLLFASLYLSLTNLEETPALDLSWDKLNHAFGYFLLTASLDIGFWTGRRMFAKMAFVLAYSFLIEVAQHFFPYRDFSMLDAAANAVGVACFLILLPLFRRQGIYRALSDSPS